VDDYWITIVKRVIQVIMVNYVYEHDFIYMDAYIGVRKRQGLMVLTSQLNQVIKSSNSKQTCIFMIMRMDMYEEIKNVKHKNKHP